MNIFLARQPILDQSNKVFGYELLFRDSDINAYNALDGDQATIEVIRNSLLNLGMGKIVGSKKAFINFSKNILKSDVYTLLSPETVIIEILEDIEPTEDVIEACKKLKEIGYIFALDDFVFDAKFLKLIEIADLIKVDFKKTLGCERKKIVDKLNSSKLKFVCK